MSTNLTPEEKYHNLEKNNYEFIKLAGVIKQGNRYLVLCICDCGTTFEVPFHKLTKLSINCGCKKSFLLSRAFHKKVEEDPTFLKRRGKSYSNWCKNHPEEIKNKGKNHSKKLRSNPECLKEQGKRHSQWYKEHPDKLAELNKQKIQWCKDNPEKVKERAKKYSQWCKEHFEEVIKKSEKYIQWVRNNPEELSKRGKLISNKKYESRVNQIKLFSETELKKLHPDDLISIYKGIIKGSNLVRVKCPNCGEFDYHRFDASVSLQDKRVVSRLCNHCESLGKSHYEDELYKYITSLGYTCIQHERTILKGKELDLFLPDKNIAVEFNGNFWHNEKSKGKYYHYNKFIECLEKGIHLFNIYEYDYNSNKYILLLNLIKNSIIEVPIRLYARNCIIKVINTAVANNFLNSYHLERLYEISFIHYGLYYKEQLTAVMSFNKVKCSDNSYELTHFATLPNIRIIGGLSKLFTHFARDYKPAYVSCYTNNDFFDGHSLSKIGFYLINRGKEIFNYHWVKKNNTLTKQQCIQKGLIRENFQDDAEINIMESLGYSRIFRSGYSKWEWRPIESKV